VAQVELLQEDSKSKVRMRYGETCEASVLDKYFDQVSKQGCSFIVVEINNTRIMIDYQL
jgi:hypothetical protein